MYLPLTYMGHIHTLYLAEDINRPENKSVQGIIQEKLNQQLKGKI